jgi:hypothetical protein
LEQNNLNDLAMLAIAEVLKKPTASITKLNISKNPALTCKTGQYIGQALLDNIGNAKLEALDFAEVCLGDSGLVRIIDAANKTPSLEKLDVGVLSDNGLKLLAERLHENTHLSELTFTETTDHQQYWSPEAQKQFCCMLKTQTLLKTVRAKFQKCNRESAESKLFLEEIQFYTE